MHLLVLGANGLLGSNVTTAARNRSWTVTGTYHSQQPTFDVSLHQLDITDTDAVRDIISKAAPDWIVNCAAMTDVDGCEERPEQAREVNARAPGDIAAYCADRSIRLLHVSTDYVFDGAEKGTYDENASVNPIQEYGASKLAGERAVTDANTAALIARLSFVYGVHQSTDQLTGFPAWVRGQLIEGERTPLFTDQYVTPTRAGQAAETFCALIEADESGLFHIAACSCVTPYEFGAEIGRRLNADDALLMEGSLSAVDRAAERPMQTCLDVAHVEERLEKVQPTLEEDLDAIAGVVAKRAVD
jgi:dTDP-4-dehydrorhamnose reductase